MITIVGSIADSSGIALHESSTKNVSSSSERLIYRKRLIVLSQTSCKQSKQNNEISMNKKLSLLLFSTVYIRYIYSSE